MRKKQYHWEVSDFDSEILGIKAVKIHAIQGDTHATAQKSIHALIGEFGKLGVQYAVYRVSTADYAIIQCLETNGFLIVDELITLRTSIRQSTPLHNDCIEKATMKHLSQLSLLSGSVFRGVSRYYHDPQISQSSADAIYKQWMRNSLDGTAADTVLVWKESEKVLGFITLKKKESHGDIPLLGVSPQARGKGIGKKLVEAAIAQCREWGFEDVSVATQGANIPALRLYQSCGFTITESHLTLRWSSQE